MKRKIYEKLVEWKQKRAGKTAILIEGARRIGKTYIIEEFAKHEYKSYVKIDFSNVSREIINIFESDITNLDNFFNTIKVLYGTELYERNSLIIFDEVQLCPKARQAIKHLVADGRYDYAETGSLISLYRNVKDILIPSEEEKIEMHPMDFEEFLWALSDNVTYQIIRDAYKDLKPLGQAIHKNILSKFREYMLVGGMPLSVKAYLNNKSFENVEFEKKQILNLYKEDINKFGENEKVKAKLVYDAIPTQLQQKSKKIKYSSIKKNTRSTDYDKAFIFLKESMMVNICNNVTDPSFPLTLSGVDEEKKCYMLDTGLLISECLGTKKYIESEIYKKMITDKLYINEGMFAENVVAQALRLKQDKLFYFKKADKENKDNNMEIDFLIETEGKITPIEVKSSVYKKHTSLDKFMSKYKSKVKGAYILYQKDVFVNEKIIHLPIYMSELLE